MSVYKPPNIADRSRERDFAHLVSEVQGCILCPRMCGRTRVLSSRNGSLTAKVMFVAEAPGRLGADRLGIPLYGDQSGRNFEIFLKSIGWRREDVFITNAVLCNPRDGQERNDTPTSLELKTCARYLKETIELIQPGLVVSLGAAALRALNHVAMHDVVLSIGVATPTSWYGRYLFPLYHPGSRALISRRREIQLADYAALAKFVGSVLKP